MEYVIDDDSPYVLRQGQLVQVSIKSSEKKDIQDLEGTYIYIRQLIPKLQIRQFLAKKNLIFFFLFVHENYVGVHIRCASLRYF